MKDIIRFEIECGEKTCAVEPKKFCRFFRSSFNKCYCYLFGRLEEENGWVQRHEDCLKHCD